MGATRCRVAAVIAVLVSGSALPGLRAQQGGKPPPAEDMGEWVPMAPLLVPRQEVGVAVLNDRIYVLGGTHGGVRLASVEVYDPGTNRWSFAASLPKPELDHIASAAVRGKLYAAGGISVDGAVRTLFEYDPATDRWTRKPDMPGPRGAAGIAVIDDRIYVAGGYSARNSVADFACYDPATEKWQALPLMPTPRDHLAAVAFGGRLHAIGGQRLVNKSGPLVGAHELFDPSTGKWSARAPLPTPRAGMGAGTLRGRIQLFGGEGNPARPEGTFAENEEYDPLTDTWHALAPMPLPRHGTQGVVLQDFLYAPGGAPRQGYSETAAVDAFRYRQPLFLSPGLKKLRPISAPGLPRPWLFRPNSLAPAGGWPPVAR